MPLRCDDAMDEVDALLREGPIPGLLALFDPIFMLGATSRCTGFFVVFDCIELFLERRPLLLVSSRFADVFDGLILRDELREGIAGAPVELVLLELTGSSRVEGVESWPR